MIKISHKNGFSIIELIIAGAISITAIGIGFSILQIALKGNKIDETQMGLNGRINDTLDFILDEVKASKRIIDDKSEIKKFNENCSYPNEGEFIFGISLPDQALVTSDYDPKGDTFNLNKVECPIVYTLKESSKNEKPPYSLIRFGPQFNEMGYYISPSYVEFQETVLLDGITSSNKYKKIGCPQNWKNIKTIKGISYCIDQYNKAIELQIEAEDPQQGIKNNDLRSIASIGGFSVIQDEAQINIVPSNTNLLNDAPSCLGGQCCWIGICLKSNKVTYLIDNSFFMNKDYLHYNGLVNNGEWIPIDNPEYISPSINGKSLFEYVINSLKQHLSRLPTSNALSDDNKKMYIQIIANNGSSVYLFEDGPQELNLDNKIFALNFLNRLKAEDQVSINPWMDICNSLESEYVGQMIILSAWKPKTTTASNNFPCAGKQEGKYSEIVKDYNQITRSKTATGALVIDSVSLFHNFCETSKNKFRNQWLGNISKNAESICVHIK